MSLPDHLLEALLTICRTPENRAMLIQAIQTGGGDLTADEIAYDNSTSGLSATDLQDAVDELAQGGGGGGAVTSVNGQTGDVELTANDVSAANLSLSNLTGPAQLNHDVRFTGQGYRIGQATIDGGNQVAAIITNSVWFDNGSSNNITALAPASSPGNFIFRLPPTGSGNDGEALVVAPSAGVGVTSFSKIDSNYTAGASGTFTSADSKTITVTNGLITSIV